MKRILVQIVLAGMLVMALSNSSCVCPGTKLSKLTISPDIALVATVKRSETETGVGTWLSAGTAVGDGATSIHGVFNYNRLAFDGGHDNLIGIGVQARRMLGLDRSGPWWVGGEATFIHDTSVLDDDFFSDNPSSNGFSLGALGGYRFPAGVVDVNAVAALNFINFGDFKANDVVIFEGGSSWQFRVGVAVGLPLRR